MTYLDGQVPLRRTWPAAVAGLALFFAGAISIGGINAFGVYLGFGFIPLLVLAIWPRNANAVLSVLFVFLGGLFTDWAAGGLVGQSSLVFIVIWGWLRPELRPDPYMPLKLALTWILICSFAILLICVSGWFVFRVSPDLYSLGRQMIIATACLPVILLLRALFTKRFGDSDDWGG